MFRKHFTALVMWAFFGGLGAILLGTASAQAEPSEHVMPLIINNDRGGRLRARIYQIAELKRTQQPVHVMGQVCFSTCTMFLGLPQTCVSSTTVFGFHGPSSYGRPLDPQVFERASELIAAHYPAFLQNWYMATARHVTNRMYRIKGSDMIRLGIPEC